MALSRHVAATTQNQALAALLLLYGQVLDQPLDNTVSAVGAKKASRLPIVLTADEA